MGNLEGFEKGFTNSKITSRKVISDSVGKLGVDNPGNYARSVSLKSNTKAAYDATNLPGGEYGMSNKGGASGDGPTPGYDGSGFGVDTLNESHGNISERKAY